MSGPYTLTQPMHMSVQQVYIHVSTPIRLYIHLYIQRFSGTPGHTHISISTSIDSQAHTDAPTHQIYVCMCLHAIQCSDLSGPYTFTQLDTNIYVYIPMCTSIRKSCACSCMYTCTYADIYMYLPPCACVCVHTYMHTYNLSLGIPSVSIRAHLHHIMHTHPHVHIYPGCAHAR